MMKSVLCTALLALSVKTQAALVAGDVAFVTFNADDNTFSLVTFTNLAPNTRIFFTDKEWNGVTVGEGGDFNAAEGFTQWDSGNEQISAGSVVYFGDSTADVLQSSLGVYSRPMLAGNQGFEIASSNEVIYAYLGTTANAPTSFLTAITNGNFANAGQITNTGLQEGLNALDLNGGASTTPDYAAYLGPRSGLNQFAEYKALVADRSNWTVDAVNGDYSNVAHDTTAFTISSVPNPPSVWLFSTALIALAGICRRQLSPCKVDKSIKAARNA